MSSRNEELEERFRSEIFGLMGQWREKGVDTRGVASRSFGCSIKKVAGWIRTAGSRSEFDSVIRQLGPSWTVESVFLRPEFEPLREIYPVETAKARDRLFGHTGE